MLFSLLQPNRFTGKFIIILVAITAALLIAQVKPSFALSAHTTPQFGFAGCETAGTAKVKVLTKGNTTTSVPYERRLSPGTNNTCVVSLQQDLNAYYNLCGGGYPNLPLLKVVQNGHLGSLTIKAVHDYQMYRGIGGNTEVNGHAIVVNGEVDLQTWAMLHDNSCSAVTD